MKFIGQVLLINQAEGAPVKCIVPSGYHDQTEFEKLKVGNEYKIDARKARNPDHHRKAFALINLIFDSQERYTTVEDMLVELKLRTGWYEEHISGRPNPFFNAVAAMIRRTVPTAPMRNSLIRALKKIAMSAESRVIYVPKSISFADMDQTQFEEFYDRVMDLAIQEYGLEDALEFL